MDAELNRDRHGAADACGARFRVPLGRAVSTDSVLERLRGVPGVDWALPAVRCGAARTRSATSIVAASSQPADAIERCSAPDFSRVLHQANAGSRH
jgi:hypothetical protein